MLSKHALETWITFDEVCRRAGISRATLNELITARKVPYRIQNGSQCFRILDLEKFFMRPERRGPNYQAPKIDVPDVLPYPLPSIPEPPLEPEQFVQPTASLRRPGRRPRRGEVRPF